MADDFLFGEHLFDLQRVFERPIELLQPHDERPDVALDAELADPVLLDRHFHDVPVHNDSIQVQRWYSLRAIRRLDMAKGYITWSTLYSS